LILGKVARTTQKKGGGEIGRGGGRGWGGKNNCSGKRGRGYVVTTGAGVLLCQEGWPLPSPEKKTEKREGDLVPERGEKGNPT